MNFITSIFTLFTEKYHTIKKVDIFEAVEKTLTSIEVNVLPSIEALYDARDLVEIKNNSIWHSLGSACDVSPKDCKTVLLKLKNTFENFVKNKHIILELVNKGMAPVSTDRSIKAKDAAIIRIVSDLGTMSSYALDILNIVAIGKNETYLPPIRIKEVQGNIESFGELYRAYGDSVKFQKLIKEVKEMSTVTLDLSKNDEGVIAYAITGQNVPALPVARGFTGNPFYHFGMWWEDGKLERAKVLEYKKQLITLRILELKQNLEKNPTDDLVKQIEVYENELAELEYKISKNRS